MYKIQISFFAGDITMVMDFSEVATYEEALNYVMNNKPPYDYHEWNVEKDGSSIIWTRYYGDEVFAWQHGKTVKLRTLQN